MEKHIRQKIGFHESFAASQLQKTMVIAKNRTETLFVNSVAESTIVLEEGAKLIFVVAATSGWEGLQKLTFQFKGRESELLFLCFIIGKAKHAFAFETISQHTALQTKAKYLVRAVMFDQSFVDYKGNLLIEKPAQLTDVYLAHHTMLLSDQARARTLPALEIEADDVKAGHAATIGKIDEELLFYLKSRGLDDKQATELFISGFFEEQIHMISEPVLQNQLRRDIEKALLFR